MMSRKPTARKNDKKITARGSLDWYLYPTRVEFDALFSFSTMVVRKKVTAQILIV
jgi:hypothetical protein